MANTRLNPNSAAIRNGWTNSIILRDTASNYWDPYTTKNDDGTGIGIILQAHTKTGEGNLMVNTFQGDYNQRPLINQEELHGTGGTNAMYSMQLPMMQIAHTRDNGNAFDANEADNLKYTGNEYSMSQLASVMRRTLSQMTFDTFSGFYGADLRAGDPSHAFNIDVNAESLDRKYLGYIERCVQEGNGMTTGAFDSTTDAKQRAPLEPFKVLNGRAYYLVVCDKLLAQYITLNNDALGIATLNMNASVRGENNAVFTGVLGTYGSLMFVEAPSFFGASKNRSQQGTATTIAGMRYYDKTHSAWTGEESFVSATHSRAFILGAKAMLVGVGAAPVYTVAKKQHDQGSESGLKVVLNKVRTNLHLENNVQRPNAAVDNMDWGYIGLNVKHKT